MNNIFIFYINENFSTYYKNKPSILFKIFEDLYNTTEEYESYALRQFDQIRKENKIDKLNEYISKLLGIRPDYYYSNGIHKVDNPELELYIRVIVKENFIHVSYNKDISIIADVLYSFSRQFFVIDFEKNKYAWIKDLCYDLVTK